MGDKEKLSALQNEDTDDLIPSQEDIDELIAELEDGNLKTEERAEIVKRFRQVFISRSGPLPPVQEIAGYEKVLPGSADRIICMAEKQADHRRRMEELQVTCATAALKESTRSEFRLSTLGSVFAFIICMTTVIVGGICIINGNSIVGFGSILLGLGSIIGAFAWSRKKSQAASDFEEDA